MIVVDTTVLVYATGMAHPLRDPCRRLLAAVAAEEIRATTTVEVVQEFTHVRSRRTDRPDAVELAEAYIALLSPLLPVDSDSLSRGLQLFRDSPRLGASDAVLAAAARAHHAVALVSADRAFADVAGLPHVFPDDEGLLWLKGGQAPESG